MIPALAARLPVVPLAFAAFLAVGPISAATAAETEEESGEQTQSSESPLKVAETAEKGSLSNPYSTSDNKVVEEGHEIYMAAGCNGCHGGTGGGGMGPPLTNPIWIYGKDDDTLFRVIALGSDKLQEQGFTRQGSEKVVGPMPEQGTIVKSTDDMWKMITWINSINQ